MNGSPRFDTAVEQGRNGDCAAVDCFIARWGTSSGAERANYQIFLAELCDVLGVPRPDPSVADDAANAYVFDKAVTFRTPDGATSTGYIDLYKKGAFVCETKQSVAKPEKDPLSVADPAAPKARRKSGTSVRGTARWDDSMIAARGQAEGYVRALADDNPPFLLVIDIGHSFELYADFSRLGKVYTAFPDARSHRFSLADLREQAIRDRLTTLWLDPLALDPARHSAKVTREIAARIAVLARRLEAKDYEPEQVAWFLIRCLFTFFSEDVCLTPRGGFTSLLQSEQHQAVLCAASNRGVCRSIRRAMEGATKPGLCDTRSSLGRLGRRSSRPNRNDRRRTRRADGATFGSRCRVSGGR